MVFQLIPFLIQLAIGVGLQIIGYLLTPKPKAAQPNETKDLEDPTAEGGRPIPVVFGEMEVTGVNILWFGNKNTKVYKVKV